MEVGNGFPAVGAVVQHEPEAGREVQLPRHCPRDQQQVAEQGGVCWLGGPDALNDPLRNHKQVDWSLGVEVVQDNALIVLVLDPGG